MKTTLVYGRAGFFGLALGYALSRIGFGSFAEVHGMFIFASLRLLFTFMGAVAAMVLGFRLLTRRARPQADTHRGTVIGGILFGLGWALTGACPAIALVQLGQGYVPALVTTVGITLGTWMYTPIHARFFDWNTTPCGD